MQLKWLFSTGSATLKSRKIGNMHVEITLKFLDESMIEETLKQKDKSKENEPKTQN